MDGPTDHYATLGVPRDADADAIKAAYRSEVRRLRPDLNVPTPARWHAVKAAHEVLTDPERRRAHDAWLTGAEERRRQVRESARQAAWERRGRTPRRGEDVLVRLPYVVAGQDFTLGGYPGRTFRAHGSAPWHRYEQLGRAGIDGGPSGDLWVHAPVVEATRGNDVWNRRSVDREDEPVEVVDPSTGDRLGVLRGIGTYVYPGRGDLGLFGGPRGDLHVALLLSPAGHRARARAQRRRRVADALATAVGGLAVLGVVFLLGFSLTSGRW